VEEARQAVFHKNKIISDMFNRQNELTQHLSDRDLQIEMLQREVASLRESASHTQFTGGHQMQGGF
jgi:predicted RNase H-like nuclease (RuvC/YqgF family)